MTPPPQGSCLGLDQAPSIQRRITWLPALLACVSLSVGVSGWLRAEPAAPFAGLPFPKPSDGCWGWWYGRGADSGGLCRVLPCWEVQEGCGRLAASPWPVLVAPRFSLPPLSSQKSGLCVEPSCRGCSSLPAGPCCPLVTPCEAVGAQGLGWAPWEVPDALAFPQLRRGKPCSAPSSEQPKRWPTLCSPPRRGPGLAAGSSTRMPTSP